jgi:hypothetical protein
MSAGLRWIALGVLLALCGGGCGGVQARREELGRALSAYHEFMRWKRFDQAAMFHPPELQSAFVARYAAVEDDLHIESMEMRSIAFAPEVEGQPPAAEIVVVAQAYLLPSTVLEKIVLQQRWENREGRWVMVQSSRELAPELPAAPALDPAPLPAESAPSAEAPGGE